MSFFFFFFFVNTCYAELSSQAFFHIGIRRHFSNPAMVYNTERSDRQMKTGSNPGPCDPHVR